MTMFTISNYKVTKEYNINKVVKLIFAYFYFGVAFVAY